MVGAATIAWSIAAILCFVFQCHPISDMWNPAAMFTNHCINIRAFYAGISGSNMALDIIALCMPVYMVWSLKLKAGQRLVLSGIFALGGL